VTATGLRPLLKAVRAYERFNAPVTVGLRQLLTLLNTKSEFVIRHLPRSGEVSATLPNGGTLRLWSRGDDWVANQVFWRGWNGYEPEVAPVFFRLGRAAAVTFDVGAHVGYYALLAGHANPRGTVHAFEPLARVRERFVRNIALNGLDNVSCHPYAVGDRDVTEQMFDDGTPVPSSASLSREFATRGGEPAARCDVTVTTLDRFVEERGIARVDLVKVDTETTEPAVLRGFAKTLARDHPALVCEVLEGYGAERKLEAILGRLGYRYYHLTPDGVVVRDKIRAMRGARNYLFTTRAVDAEQLGVEAGTGTSPSAVAPSR
jgi:FkbM family methyltransferase